MYLLNEGKINFAILADINKGPLENARSEVKRNKLEDKVDLRLGSGIEVLKKGEGFSWNEFVICFCNRTFRSKR